MNTQEAEVQAKTIVVGCKLLKEDGGSMRESGRVIYPIDEWITVGGNGAYVAITDGLLAAGKGPLLAFLECEDDTGADAPFGVACFRRVRRVEPCWDQIGRAHV